MPKGVYKLPNITNEPIKSYAPGSPERAALKEKLNEIHNQVVDIPMIIGGKEIRTDKLADIRPPHDHQHLLGHYHQGDASHVQLAIDAESKTGLGKDELGKPGCYFSESGRADSRSLPSDFKCRDDVGTIQECFSGRDRLCL